MEVTLSLLRNIPSLRAIPESLAAAVAKKSVLRTYSTGQRIADQGNHLDFLLFLVKGSMHAIAQQEGGQVVGRATVLPGEPVGWLSVIDLKPIYATLIAATDSVVLFIPTEIARDSLLPEPSVNKFVLQMLASGIRQHLDERRVLTLPNAFQRVFLHLHQLAQSTQAGGNPMLPKQQDIATSVNTSRETVSRAIQLLVKRGVLHKRGHQVIILKHDQLKALATGPAPIGHGEATNTAALPEN